MEHHFDWVWRNASISLNEYLDGGSVGTDQGTHESAAVNVYTNPQKGGDRIADLLRRAQRTIAIQGISLNSFFKPGVLREALAHALSRGTVKVEVLLLDPDSEQAHIRSYRERLFVSPSDRFDEYEDQRGHQKSDMYHDTMRTIENIKHMVSDLRGLDRGNWRPQLTVARYSSAPACFALRIDDHVLVEQYHYGKLTQGTRAILGKDMPLVEYCDATNPLYRDGSSSVRQPFGLLVNHLEFVLAQSEHIPILDTNDNHQTSGEHELMDGSSS
jgi:hypothetical protein